MPLPAGYTLDQPQGGPSAPNLPAGYKLDTTSTPPDHPSYWQELYQQSGIPGLIKGLKEQPAETVAAAIGGLFAPLSSGFALSPQAQAIKENWTRSPESAAAQATLGVLAAAPVVGKMLPPELGPALKAGAAAARPDVGIGAAKVAAGSAMAEMLPGGPMRYAIGAAPAYSGARQIMRGLGKGATAFGKTMRGTEEAGAAADPLLDQIAQGYGVKGFDSLNEADQATVRDLAARMGSNQAATGPVAPPAYVPRPPEYYGVKPATTPPAPAEAPPATAAIPPEEYYANQKAPAPEAPPPAAAPAATPEPPQPEPATPQAAAPATAADAVKARFAQAKADRFVDAIRRFNSDNPQQALSADELAGAGDEEKSMLTRGLKQGGYLGNTEKFPDTSFPYILSKLKDAEAAASQTIKPPAGFSLGAMKRYPAPEAASPAPSAIDSTPAIKQNAEVTPTAQETPTEAPAKPAFQYKGFLGTLGDTERENLLSVMREYGNKAMAYGEQHAQLRPKYGEIAVGGAHMDPLINQYGIEAVGRELGRGATIEDAIAAGKQEAALTAQKFNARVKGEGGYQIHRPEGLANSMLDEYGRRLRAALKQ